MILGEKLDKRPDGPLLAMALGPGIDGWQFTKMERQTDGEVFIKKSRLRLGNRTESYEAEWYTEGQS